MDRLADEVLRVARDLIRIDTTNGNETEAAAYLRDYLRDAGLEAELVAKDPARANLVVRWPGSGEAPSLAYVGHLDVVPADARDWTHPPFEAVVDDGWLYGRGAIDMKNEVAARCVAVAELARSGFRPAGDLWLLMVADEEDGADDVGMRWLLEARPDIRPDLAINEGGGHRLPLADGRTVSLLSVGEKGTQPVRVSAVGEAGHASTPTIGDNAVPLLGEVLRRIGRGLPVGDGSPWLDETLGALLGESTGGLATSVAAATALHPSFAHELPPLAGTTMAPTMLGGSPARNVMPARAWVELDCRVLPDATPDEVLAAVRGVLGDDLRYELDLPEAMVPGSASPTDGPLPTAVAAVLADLDPGLEVVPILCTGYTDSSFLRFAGGTSAYGFSPFRSTPAEVLDAGYHNADERVHVDDLTLSVAFHVELARRVLG
jgi:acetylornithine deacetylase/succinyl-diaminopimelate desuccinylase-like protein